MLRKTYSLQSYEVSFHSWVSFSTQVIEFAKKFKFLYMNLKEVDEM